VTSCTDGGEERSIQLSIQPLTLPSSLPLSYLSILPRYIHPPQRLASLPLLYRSCPSYLQPSFYLNPLPPASLVIPRGLFDAKISVYSRYSPRIFFPHLSRWVFSPVAFLNAPISPTGSFRLPLCPRCLSVSLLLISKLPCQFAFAKSTVRYPSIYLSLSFKRSWEDLPWALLGVYSDISCYKTTLNVASTHYPCV